MKIKSFISPIAKYQDDKKPLDYWGLLFVSFIFIASMSCFLFVSH